MPRALSGDSAPSWVTRGANFVVVVTRVRDGDELLRDNPDEYMLLLPEGGPAAVLHDGTQTLNALSDSLSILPPGRTRVALRGAGLVARIFSSDATDLLALADNAAAYVTPNSEAAPLVAWPDPPAGFKLRSYHLPQYVSAGSTLRVFRSCKLMVNPLTPRHVPRDVHTLSPHAHADFEQGSLALEGTYIHHLRYPWGPDMDLWREDEQPQMDSPSLLVVPPKVVHTSRNIGPEVGRLVDIFAPPRFDFSRRGIVCNADEYPMPADAG
jgi:mannose-6-phosphate isomerase-like protein (cupin superfamily)